MKRRPGVSFCNPQHQLPTQRTKDGFVEDVTAWTNRFVPSLMNNHHDIEPIAEELQAMAQQWEGLLCSAGGALELSKCFYYLIKRDFDSNANPVLTTPVLPQLSVTSSATGEAVTIAQLECDKPTKRSGSDSAPTAARMPSSSD
jgi:hypothetical protein